MGNVFGSNKPLKDIIRENQRMLNRSIRELEREISRMQTQTKKLESEIKKMGQQNQIAVCKALAKDLVRTRRNISRFLEMKSHLSGISMKLMTVKSHDALAQSMKGVTKALKTINAQTTSKELQKILHEFTKENERSEMVQEAMGDAIDDALDEEGAQAEEDLIVTQILDEMGIAAGQTAPDAPMKMAAAASPVEEKDGELDALQARLDNLKRNP